MSSLGVSDAWHNRSRSSSNASTANLRLSARHNPQPAVDFTIRVEEIRKQYIGRNGNGESVSYVPVHELRTYWTDLKVRELSQAYTPHLTFNYEAVNQICLRLFSILVYTNRVQFFDALQAKVSDEQLPLVEDNLPQSLKSPVFKDVLEDMYKHQWIFCPLIMDYARLTNLELEPDHILPFQHVEEITEGDAAHIFKINIHKSCNRLHPKDKITGRLPRGEPPPDGVYVLKSYHGDRYRRLFLNESKALTTLHQKSEKEHIVGYYGSYIQNGNFNLLLQFANAGSLLDYYRDPAIHPPKEPDDIRQFWKSLVGVLKGLHQVHQIKPKSDELAEFRDMPNRIHEDIKPDNILLHKAVVPKSVYDFTPLLTDFGHSHFRVPTDEEDEMGVDRQGNQTYGAPEVSRHARYLVNLPGQIPTAADIWSMGCVMSDAAAWVVFGPDGREEYRRLREESGSENENFEDPGHFDCFHDATDRSEAVDKMHARIREACHPEDAVTPQLLVIIENHMLIKDRKKRWTAKEVYESSYKIIWKSERKKTLKEIKTMVQTNVESVTKRITEYPGIFGDKKVEVKEHSQGDIASTPEPGLQHHGAGSKLTSALPSRPKIKKPWSCKDREKESAADSEGAPGISTPNIVNPDDDHHQQTPPITLSTSPNLPPRPSPALYDHSDIPLTRLSDEFSPSGESHMPGPFSPTSEAESLLSPPIEPDHGGSHVSRPSSPALSVTSNMDPIRDVDVNDLVKSDLTLDEAKKWRSDWKGWSQPDPDQHKTIRELRHTLKGRDHIFFLDDSRNMKRYAPEIEEAFETLAYIVKPRDGKDSSGSVSLAIGTTTASSANGKKTRTLYTNSSQTTKLVDILREKCSYERIETVIEDVFSEFIDKEIIPRLPLENRHRESLSSEAAGKSSGSLLQRSASASRKRSGSHSTPNANPISLIVFTNGQWGDGKLGAGIDIAIKRLTDQLKERELKRTQVMIQFLRFGGDENGIRNLEYLAGLGKDSSGSSDEYKGYSIVDTQPITGNLCSMLIGSISNSHITEPILKHTENENPL